MAKNGCKGDERVGNDEERVVRGREDWKWQRTGVKGTRGLAMTKNGWVGDKRVGNDEEQV